MHRCPGTNLMSITLVLSSLSIIFTGRFVIFVLLLPPNLNIYNKSVVLSAKVNRKKFFCHACF